MTLYKPGSNLEIPGLEAIFEYGDASRFKDGRIPGAMLINDHSKLDKVRVTQLDGLHDDPEGGETRQANADRHGERAGQMLYRGRTVGMTGRVEAGSIGAMRNNWRRFRSQFGKVERDLLVHHPFEVPTLVNEVFNPTLATDAYGWGAPMFRTGGGTPGVITAANVDGITSVGQVVLTGATGAGRMSVYPSILQTPNPLVNPWEGQDIWVCARVKVHAATGTVTAAQVGVTEWSAVLPDGSATAFAATPSGGQTSPSTGTWYTIARRVLASEITSTAAYLTPAITLTFSSGGTYTLRFTRVAMVFLDADEPTPTSYFDGDMPGFAWQGAPGRSSSIGPTHARNMIEDPRFEDFNPSTMRLNSAWGTYTAGGAITFSSLPSRSLSWPGNNVDAAGYVSTVKDNNSTSRAMGLQALSNNQQYFPVVEGRRYRFSAAVKLVTKPATGNVLASITWVNQSGTAILTNNSDPLVIGENLAAVEQTAPAGAVAVVLSIWNPATTTPAATLTMYWSDPCFVDVTDWDPGDFYGVGDQAEEADVYRRIPRPFLLRGVRKTSDMKAPEQQSRSRAWRDFTMSLRASDPRIYAFDERSRWIQMVGSPQLVFANTYGLIAYNGVITTAPTGFTAEGQTGTTGWHYGTQSTFDSRQMMSIGNAADAAAAAPAAVAIQRAYRSVEGYTYTKPRVIVHGHFQMKWDAGSFIGAAIEWPGGTGAVSPYSYNAFGVVLKRVSSSQWLEVRVNASDHATFQAFFGVTNAPYTVELWSSHDASGAAAVTRLAQWDISGGIRAVSDPSQYPIVVQAEIDANNNVNIEVTGTSNVGAPMTSLSQTYALPSGLLALFGTAVAGQVGEWIRSDNWNALSNWSAMTSRVGFPWISYFEASVSDVAPGTMRCPVIGDVDTPQKIVLRGDIDSPIVSLASTDEGGDPISSTIRLNGVAQESNPVIIDVGEGTIEDSLGANRYSMLDSGYLQPLQPGINDFVVTARNWDTSYAHHVQAIWRDALA